MESLEAQVKDRTAELADARSEVLFLLARTAEYRDDESGRHAQRVGLLSSLIASELGVNHRGVDRVRRIAPLHDIGKIAVPDAVLRKPDRLTTSEFELMKAHTVVGAALLGSSPHNLMRAAAEIARSHHERWDGSGYPDGLSGAAIPPNARIVALADVFDTLTHPRPYKDAFSPERARNLITAERGRHFDPEVVDAFFSILGRTRPGELMALSDPVDPFADRAMFGGSARD
ncbi:MAG: HD domain-containing protein [Longimicrobiales bacterium]